MPIDLIGLTQASQHSLVQLLPDESGTPVQHFSAARHATAVAQGLRKVRQWYAGLQHEQDAVERCFVDHLELARPASG